MSTYFYLVRRKFYFYRSIFCLSEVANGGQAIVVNLERGSRNKLFSHLVYWFYQIPSMEALANPFRRGSWGWGVLDRQNYAAGGANDSIIVGMFVCLCLARKKPSEREFFVPAGTDLGVKLLNSYTHPTWLRFWYFGSLVESKNDVIMLWLRLAATLNCFPHLHMRHYLVNHCCGQAHGK